MILWRIYNQKTKYSFPTGYFWEQDMYIMIQNKGEAPITAYTLLGDSGSRGKAGTIGQFGSGNKHGLTLLLRLGIEFYIYCGRNKLEFYTERQMIEDANGTKRIANVVMCRISGTTNRTIECGWVLEFGAVDWREPKMALREFISNAIDAGDPVVEPANKPRAKSGFTRVFITLTNSDVANFYHNLSTHFLHFCDRPEFKDASFLPKNPDTIGPRVYFEGVLIGEIPSKIPSVFDYNFKKGEIAIDECRNSSEYTLRARIASKINKADSQTLGTLFHAMAEGERFEGSLDDYYLGYDTGGNESTAWQDAWNEFAPDAVIADKVIATSLLAEHVRAKGYKVKAIHSEAMVKVAKAMDVPDVIHVLGRHVAQGKIECEVTDAAIRAVKQVWDWCEAANMTAGKPMPKVACFRQLMDGEGETLGFHDFGTDVVNIREDLEGKIALKTAIEEVAHYITGSTDCSRDFQNFAFDMIVELCS